LTLITFEKFVTFLETLDRKSDLDFLADKEDETKRIPLTKNLWFALQFTRQKPMQIRSMYGLIWLYII